MAWCDRANFLRHQVCISTSPNQWRLLWFNIAGCILPISRCHLQAKERPTSWLLPRYKWLFWEVAIPTSRHLWGSFQALDRWMECGIGSHLQEASQGHCQREIKATYKGEVEELGQEQWTGSMPTGIPTFSKRFHGCHGRNLESWAPTNVAQEVHQQHCISRTMIWIIGKWKVGGFVTCHFSKPSLPLH